ncbi:hypothetical protein ACIODS_24405 [Micromonospora chalcea]|uniref:hypothetical protein n=1 Tax=Micromonospora chalcea TaxID=1874 RepID=UPI003811361E
MSHFADTIAYLASEDPRERISAIKGAVIENLRATDQRMLVEVTDHFNHSYVPDLVLSWPGTSERRNVFLRTSFRAWDLMQDLEFLAAERPILMPLAPIEPTDQEYDNALERRSREHRTLITDPYGLEAFDEETESAPVVSLLSHAILQGGRGVISSNGARRISEVVGAGFIGARNADYDTTSTAVLAAETALDSHRASQLNRLLHALWVGSGAPPTQFPGATGITTALDAEGLKFILEMPDLDDPEFWDRLGRSITTERLCQLIDFSPTPNLQRLVRGSVHRLSAKACRVVNVESGVPAAQWEIISNTLTLRTPLHRIHFAPRYVNELPENRLSGQPIPVRRLQARAELAGVSVGEVKLSNGDSTVSYGSEERPNIAQDETLAAVERAIDGALVVAATARIGQGPRTVRCNLAAGTGSGISNAIYRLTELATIAVPLLADLAAEEWEEIRLQTMPVPEEETE